LDPHYVKKVIGDTANNGLAFCAKNLDGISTDLYNIIFIHATLKREYTNAGSSGFPSNPIEGVYVTYKLRTGPKTNWPLYKRIPIRAFGEALFVYFT
jgi:hypothetical protein